MSFETLEPEAGAIEVDVEDRWRAVVGRVKAEYTTTAQNYPWILAFSGGKDSTLVAQAVFEVLLDMAPSRRTRPVHIVSNDTLVENPAVARHLHMTLEAIEEGAKSLGLPITVNCTTPDPQQTFWALLLGKGYASPTTQNRWCTDRLKIKPTSTFIRQTASRDGSAIVLLGVRSNESARRRASIARHTQAERLNPHASLPDVLVFRPIVDLLTDEVWHILGSHEPPWGGTHASLIELYRDAAGGECPVILSEDEAPGCGTNSSRFGCWTCTVVEKDRSMSGCIQAGHTNFQPLLDFRDKLKTMRTDPTKRQAVRRNGQVKFDAATGRHIPGPFTVQARHALLQELLAIQDEIGIPLISAQEINTIHAMWASDLNQHLSPTETDPALVGQAFNTNQEILK